MKALQKDKRTAQQNGTSKEAKSSKNPSPKKKQDFDLNNMVFSELDVWPILAELNNLKN